MVEIVTLNYLALSGCRLEKRTSVYFRQFLKAEAILMFLVLTGLCSLLRFLHCFEYFMRISLQLSNACCVNSITQK